jgi:hypothetical protein
MNSKPPSGSIRIMHGPKPDWSKPLTRSRSEWSLAMARLRQQRCKESRRVAMTRVVQIR